jgi:hypothetical protein
MRSMKRLLLVSMHCSAVACSPESRDFDPATSEATSAATSGAGGGGVAACDDGLTFCSGACADTSSDPEHCGACGHYCLGQACVDSRCEPLVLASGGVEPIDIAVDDTTVYWVDPGARKVMTVPVGGGNASLFIEADPPFSPRSIALGSGNVYYTDSGLEMIVLTSLDDAFEILAEGRTYPLDIAADAANVYWTSADQGTVMKVAIDGSSDAVALAEGQESPLGLVVDATHVYWTNSADGTVMKLPK